MTNSKISLKTPPTDIFIILSLASLALSLWLIQSSNIDLELQQYLFDSQSKDWLFDRAEPIKKLFFYNGPKILFGLTILLCLIARFVPKFQPRDIAKRQRLTLIILGLILIPLIAGNIKKFTNVYCPANLEIYGGDKPYVKIFDSYPQDFHSRKKGQCFPAGHCVTGFALMILFFALQKKSMRLLSLFSSITLGWSMGFYQMAKGVHFFGDTLISMLLCFFLAALITRFYLKFSNL